MTRPGEALEGCLSADAGDIGIDIAVNETFHVHQCWVDQEPCEVVEHFQDPNQDNPVDVSDHLDLLTCDRCRAAEQVVASLSGLRLGNHERRILRAAPDPEQNYLHIEPDSDSHSAQVAHRRALLKLKRRRMEASSTK